MCGRYTFITDRKAVAKQFGVPAVPELPLRYNVAPTQPVPAVRLDQESGARELSLLRWGLIPHWAKDTKAAGGLINARAETAAEKPAFRTAFRRRRCLMPARAPIYLTQQGRGCTGKWRSRNPPARISRPPREAWT